MTKTCIAGDGEAADMLALDAALTRLSADYWHDVDHHAGRNAHEYFVEEDSFYQIQDQIFAGREAIKQFYAWRAGRGERVARHCFVNARSVVAEDGTARMTSILLLYAADGRPILPTAAPIQIADVEDICVPVNGIWRYRSRRLTTLFAGGVPITLPS
ncbi:nuclear transport factor 2 family protein [Paraburkholderia megapolitana]|uniref:nuclear transport factor 2 family protein n=1 Tax=Paraburkholderia megapolitana TaxID=420953 RepID=UPI0038BCC05F